MVSESSFHDESHKSSSRPPAAAHSAGTSNQNTAVVLQPIDRDSPALPGPSPPRCFLPATRKRPFKRPFKRLFAGLEPAAGNSPCSGAHSCTGAAGTGKVHCYAPGKPAAASSASVVGSAKRVAPGRAPMRLLPAVQPAAPVLLVLARRGRLVYTHSLAVWAQAFATGGWAHTCGQQAAVRAPPASPLCGPRAPTAQPPVRRVPIGLVVHTHRAFKAPVPAPTCLVWYRT